MWTHRSRASEWSLAWREGGFSKSKDVKRVWGKGGGAWCPSRGGACVKTWSLGGGWRHRRVSAWLVVDPICIDLALSGVCSEGPAEGIRDQATQALLGLSAPLETDPSLGMWAEGPTAKLARPLEEGLVLRARGGHLAWRGMLDPGDRLSGKG